MDKVDKLVELIADKYIKNLEDYVTKAFRNEPCLAPPLHPNCRCIVFPMTPILTENGWIPIFMLVKDIKSVRYRFNLDNIRIEHKTDTSCNWHKIDFTGYRVEKPQTIFKKADKGLIAKVLSRFSNGLPQWLVVQWGSGDYS